MRTIWQSLVWKEWHEHKWKALALVAILWGVLIFPLIHMQPGILVGVMFGLAIGIAPLAVFVGVSTAASERSRGTLRFTQALPVPMWRVAFNKFFLGLLTIILPALLAMLFIFCWVEIAGLLSVGPSMPWQTEFNQSDRDRVFPFTSNAAVAFTLLVSFAAASFYTWAAAAGVNRKDEVSAGAVALSVIVGWCLLIGLGWFFAIKSWGVFDGWPSQFEKAIGVIATSTAPGGLLPVNGLARAPNQWLFIPALITAVVTHLALATFFVTRFGRISNLEVASPLTAPITTGRLAWLGMPRSSPFAAIAWKQFRESGPIAAAGTAMAIAIFAIVATTGDIRSSDLGPAYIGITIAMGMAISVVIGIGVVINDVRPGISTFWRSRPINVDVWFWTKFVSGLAVLLLGIYTPLLLAAALSTATYRGPWNVNTLEFLQYPACHVAVYASAVMLTCLVRHAVYAAILSAAVTYLGCVTIAVLQWIGSQLGWVDRGPRYLLDLTETELIAGMAFTFIMCAILGWLAMRNDWGQKSGNR